MNKPRLFVSSIFASLLCLSWLVTPAGSQPDTLKQIMSGVWFREGDLKSQGHCNNIIIEMKDSLIVVDANFPSGARLAMGDAKKVSSKPVKYVFDTHHHGDHAYGNAVWTKAGAITLAYVGVAEEMKRYEPKRWQEAAKDRKDVGELNLSTAEPPKETFSKSPHVIEDSTRRVEFHFFGWAHTRGDGFVFLPKEKLVCTGDAVVNGPYNYTGDGNIKNWPNVIRGVQKLGAERVLPAHGGAGGKEILAGQLAFFEELLKTVGASIKQGKKLEDLVKKKGAKQVATIKLPDGVKNWVGDFFASQVENAYKEITTGKPSGDAK
jgi:glyoxylase-like metal-dependent hydrolase (beta-lactamase superfamily II)